MCCHTTINLQCFTMQGGVGSVTPYPQHFLAGQIQHRFNNHMQQDCHDLLLLWLDALSEDLKKVKCKTSLQLSDLPTLFLIYSHG